MKVIDEWRQAWKWFSVNIHAANVAFLVAWANLPQKFQDALPLPWVIGIAVALLVAGIAGRMVKQDEA